MLCPPILTGYGTPPPPSVQWDLASWLVGCSFFGLVGWLLVGWFQGCSVWLTGWLVGWLVGWLLGWLVDVWVGFVG